MKERWGRVEKGPSTTPTLIQPSAQPGTSTSSCLPWGAGGLSSELFSFLTAAGSHWQPIRKERDVKTEKEEEEREKSREISFLSGSGRGRTLSLAKASVMISCCTDKRQLFTTTTSGAGPCALRRRLST